MSLCIPGYCINSITYCTLITGFIFYRYWYIVPNIFILLKKYKKSLTSTFIAKSSQSNQLYTDKLPHCHHPKQ